ncbi:Calcium/calmodulin-dependent 3',5'-cyclic nucleotide phosphodiesterase 1C [Liparis tanakae]|uniref:Calcium/calmodulin-dependent 3',5'-cyclic nucleotide phosphodiesterase 1C n=1 Tax=Liparis tanakae TaxID=230148 RepID=A0A4Z2ILN4_9TELE|nr:Calcium/calmodulin-dependent 3',5'-cyclic nucleotide phosphodiesterase 1C [Liparis tanakae]
MAAHRLLVTSWPLLHPEPRLQPAAAARCSVALANEDGESSTRPQANFERSKSQSALWNAITAGMGIKGTEQKAPLNDLRSPEEILADDLPATDQPDATEKTAIRSAPNLSHSAQACPVSHLHVEDTGQRVPWVSTCEQQAVKCEAAPVDSPQVDLSTLAVARDLLGPGIHTPVKLRKTQQ